MDISVIGSGANAAMTSVSSSQKATDTPATTASMPATTAATTTSDTVTLSSAAQQAVANASSATPTLADTLSAKAAATTDKDLAQFYGTAATVVDTSGQYTEDQQLDAYLQFKTCSLKWQYSPSLTDWQDVFTAVTQDSTIAKKSAAVTDTYNAAAMKATQSPDTDNDQGIAQAKLDAADAMSVFDRKVLFETKVNTSYSGAQYTDQASWLSSLQDQASGKAVSPLASNYKTLYSLAAVITDTTGKYSKDDQLNAYVEYRKVGLYLPWKDADGSALHLLDKIDSESFIARLETDTYNKIVNPACAQFVLGDADSGRRAEKVLLDGFNELSDFDKKVFFETSVNEVLLNRGHPYSSMQQWLDKVTAFANGGTVQTATAQSGAEKDGGKQTAGTSSANATNTGANDQTAPATDADKALAILKAYTAGQATQTDSDKALAALKENAAGKSDNDAALLILKNAAAESTTAQHPATSAASKTASPAKQTSGETGTATAETHNTTGSAISLTA